MLRGGRAISATVLFGVLVASCASAPDSASQVPVSEATPFPVEVRAANGRVEITARPEAIVSLSATATEDLFAIGAGDQVIAVDDQSNYPPEAPTTDLSAYEPNVEAILSYSPDLVVVAGDPGDLEPSFAAADVPLLLLPAATDVHQAYRQIQTLGRATGHAAEAHRLAASMREEILAIVTSIGGSVPISIYHELDDTFFSATSDTFIGQVYSTFGMTNIADGAAGAGSGYPQLSAEYIIQANPDVIFLSDAKCCDQSAATVAARPGWDHITAVRQGRIVELDEDIASRWGPRVVDLFKAVASALPGRVRA
jgi:iron complex transport system substrate-binding protein